MGKPITSADILAPVTLSAALRTKEIDAAALFGGAAFVLGLSDGTSLRTSGDGTGGAYSWTNFDAIVDDLVSRRMNCMLTIGTDFPRWANMVSSLGVSSWAEVNRPPTEAWPYWVADANAAIARLKSKYLAAGLDPFTKCCIQMAREVAKGGAGGPWNASGIGNYSAPYAALAAGTWERAADLASDTTRNVHSQLLYMAQNINTLGIPLVSPSLETQPSDVAQELATVVNGAWLSTPDWWAFDHYITLTVAQSQTVKQAATAYYDSIMSTRASIVAAVTAWANKPCVLAEFGGSNTQFKIGSSLHPQHGHARRGEILARTYERLVSHGGFQWINFYAARERTAVSDASIFGLLDSTGAFLYSHRTFNRMAGNGDSTIPIGGYTAGTSETGGIA